MYCGKPLKTPNQKFCNTRCYAAYKESGPIIQMDPIVDFLSKINVSDDILKELDCCSQTFDTYEKYHRATDLFVLKMILGNVKTWEAEPNNPNYKAFENLIKWMMYLIAVNPWWHRKLCYFNRMMGVNMNASSYWHLQYHPHYVPGQNWNDNLDVTPKEFNDSQMDQKEIYKWIDEQLEEHQ